MSLRDEAFKQRPSPRAPLLLLKVLGLSALGGAALGVAFVSLMLDANVAGLGDLIARSDEPLVPLLLMYVFQALTFAATAMGVTIMTMRKD